MTSQTIVATVHAHYIDGAHVVVRKLGDEVLNSTLCRTIDELKIALAGARMTYGPAIERPEWISKRSGQ